MAEIERLRGILHETEKLLAIEREKNTRLQATLAGLGENDRAAAIREQRLRDENTRLGDELERARAHGLAALQREQQRAPTDAVLARLAGENTRLSEEIAALKSESGHVRALRWAEKAARLEETNTRLKAAVESGSALLRIATRALGFYAEPDRWSHEQPGWAWAVTNEGPERAARALESIRAKSPASDSTANCKPSNATCEHGWLRYWCPQCAPESTDKWSTGEPR